MYNTIIIDGVTYHMVCDIKRTATIKSSDISGYLLDKTYYNDVLGTYYEYTINLVVPTGYETEYSSLYDVITSPVPQHSVTLPYNQGVITLNGRIVVVTDEYSHQETRNNTPYNIWRKTSFKVLSNEPRVV